MCDEIKNPKVRKTLDYIIRGYDHDTRSIIIRAPKGPNKLIPFNDIKEGISDIWDGRIALNGDLCLDFYVDDDYVFVKNSEIHIKNWEINEFISYVAS